MNDHPKVFISYSHDSEEHKEWVRKLGADLRKNGVDVFLDQWDVRLGMDLAVFMEQGLSNSQMVLCICSDTYVEKSNDRKGGTGYESVILKQPLITNANKDHIICVLRNNNKKLLPIALGTRVYTDFSDDRDYKEKFWELLERIYDVDKSRKPALGKNPFSALRAQEILIKTELNSNEYSDSKFQDTATFNFTNNDGKFSIGSGEYEFITQWSRAGEKSIYALNDSVLKLGYFEANTEFPKSDDLEKFDYTSRARNINQDEVFVLMNVFRNFAAIKVIRISGNMLTFEYRIYE